MLDTGYVILVMKIEKNISLKAFNTFGIDVRAEAFARFNTIEVLEELLQHNNQPLILGGGSNLLFTKDVAGLVLKNEISGIALVAEDEDYVYIKAGAGESWHGFVQYCISQNWAGVENLSLIPGNVGASPMQNIGAYGVEIKDVFHALEAYHINEKKLQQFNLIDCAFGYRESVFKRKYKGQFVITSVTYRLRKQPVFNTSYGAIEQELAKMGITQLSIQAIAQAVINIRSSKLPNPAETGNAGSFFKNPEVPAVQFEQLKKAFPNIVGYTLDTDHVKVAAGWLIENCGPQESVSWKGYRIGDAGCHPKQALVLVNYGHATGSDIYALSEAILQSVKNKFGILLEREVNII